MSKSTSRFLWIGTGLLIILAMILSANGSLATLAADGDEAELRGALPLPDAGNAIQSSSPDPVLQNYPGVINMPGTIKNWEGIPATGVYPPDTDGQVGPNHYVQIVNAASTGSRVRVWDKEGNQLYDFGLNNLWPSGDRCQLYGYGDPVVLYDQIADRWLLTQFTYPSSGPYNECIAVSKTGTPTSTPSDWYLYTFNVHPTKFNDYPKLGVWPDGYYMMAHQFTSTWSGTGVWVFNREKMINGTMPQSPTAVTCSNTSTECYYKDLYTVNSNYGGMLPVNLMGNTLPPAGSPNYFVEVDANWYGTTDIMTIFGFKVDWTNPANSKFGRVGEIAVADFDYDLCSASREQCIDQPGTSVRLEAISDRLMMHAWYRNMGDHEVVVLNHTVDASGSGRAGVRWYEIRKDNPSIPTIYDPPTPPSPNWGPWEVYQQGTYSPDSHHRWMGSIAMDATGNIAIGYSISSTTVHPGIRYAGRLVSDPLGTLPQAEGTIINGSGSQTGAGARWGDYSALSVDPVDDCTFWYTTEYMQTTSATGWQTRVASFKFPNCTANNPGTLNGNVTNAATSAALKGVTVKVTGSGSYQATTNASGNYSISAAPGTYSVTFEKFGYISQTFNSIEVLPGEVTTRNAALVQLPVVTIQGAVIDNNTGWPLYARIRVTTTGYEAAFFTDPVTGEYSFDLPQGFSYNFEVSAFSGGYVIQNRAVNLITEAVTENFSLAPDLAACSAPGYQLITLEAACLAVADGLVVGHVYDANTISAVNGALVSDDLGATSLAVATPDDPNLDSGFYILGSTVGLRQLTATYSTFGPNSQSVTVQDGAVVSQNFYLPSAHLEATPNPLEVSLLMGAIAERTVVFANTGTATASFDLGDVVNASPSQIYPGTFEPTTRRVSPKRVNALEASAVYEYTAPAAARITQAGSVVAVHNPGLSGLWGLGVNPSGNQVWLGSISAAGGNDSLNPFDLNGNPTGTPIDVAGAALIFGADLTYNPFTGMLWQVGVDADNCLYAIDPANSQVTGERICPLVSLPQRSVAYDVTNDTFYLGSWVDGSIHRTDVSGNLLESHFVNLNISGLAFNPATNHLFVLANADTGYDVYVLDVNHEYAILGGFDVAGVDDFAAAGLGLDCDGNLWIANQVSGQVIVAASGESGICGWEAISWLEADPTHATVLPGESQDVVFTIDTTGLNPGFYQAQVRVANDTPYGTFYLPVRLTLTQETYAVSVAASFSELGGDPGQTVTYYVDVTNLGKNTDSYNIVVDSAWGYSAVTAIGPMTSGATRSFAVNITVPADAMAGASDLASITITSVADPAKSDTLDLTTTANLVAGVSIAPVAAEQSGMPGRLTTYAFTVTNLGNGPDSFDISIGGETWTTTAAASVGPLAAGASSLVDVSVDIPPTAVDSSSDLATVTVTSQADGHVSDSATLTTTAQYYSSLLPLVLR